MIAELGVFFLILTLIVSSLGFISPILKFNENSEITQIKISKTKFFLYNLLFCYSHLLFYNI